MAEVFSNWARYIHLCWPRVEVGSKNHARDSDSRWPVVATRGVSVRDRKREEETTQFRIPQGARQHVGPFDGVMSVQSPTSLA